SAPTTPAAALPTRCCQTRTSVRLRSREGSRASVRHTAVDGTAARNDIGSGCSRETHVVKSVLPYSRCDACGASIVLPRHHLCPLPVGSEAAQDRLHHLPEFLGITQHGTVLMTPQ